MSADAEEVPGGGARRRIPFLDQARGAALLAMFWYHLSWDLTYFGLAGFALLEDPFWLAARAAILSAFLAISGVALALATRDRLAFGALLRRLGVVAAAALAVSVATRLAFPETWIFFGVLHCIALSGLLALPLLRLPWPAVAALGLALLVLPVLPGVPRLEHDGLLWLGLVVAVPPRSAGMASPAAVTRSMARMRRVAAPDSPRCSSSITADQKLPMGSATPLPMISKAEP